MGFVDGGEEKLVDGIYLPTDLTRLRTHTGVSYVLMQQEGKRRIKDLKEIIRQRKMTKTTEHDAEMATIQMLSDKSKPRGDGVRPADEASAAPAKDASLDLEALDDPAVPKEVKQLIFELELKRVQAAITDKELRLSLSVGM